MKTVTGKTSENCLFTMLFNSWDHSICWQTVNKKDFYYSKDLFCRRQCNLCQVSGACKIPLFQWSAWWKNDVYTRSSWAHTGCVSMTIEGSIMRLLAGSVDDSAGHHSIHLLGYDGCIPAPPEWDVCPRVCLHPALKLHAGVQRDCVQHMGHGLASWRIWNVSS